MDLKVSEEQRACLYRLPRLFKTDRHHHPSEAKLREKIYLLTKTGRKIWRATVPLTYYLIGEQKQQPHGCETTQKFTW